VIDKYLIRIILFLNTNKMKKYMMSELNYFGIFFLSFFTLIGIVSVGLIPADAAMDAGKIIILKDDLPHNGEPLLNKEQIQECENFYYDYTTLPEPEFNKKYFYHQFIGDCVLLYDDQIWQYEGEDRYDKLSFRLTELRENLDETRSKQIESMPEFTTRYVTESELPGKFIYVFEVCAKNDSINANNIVVASDKDIIPAVRFPDEFIIRSDTCEEFEVEIAASDSNLIRVHNLNEEREVNLSKTIVPEINMDESKNIISIKSPREQVKSGVDFEDVKCMPGFELIMKNSDDSPACVSPVTKIKLIDRGWAKSQ